MHMTIKSFGAALILSLSFSSLVQPVVAKELSKDDFRARVVDYCLYDQWARAKNGETKGILNDCRCAAKAFVNGLEKDELAALLKTGSLDRGDKKAVLTQYAICRK